MAQAAVSDALLAWVQGQLNILIGADEFAPLLLSLSDYELEEYCNGLLGATPTTLSFVNQLISRRNQEQRRHDTSHARGSKPKQTNKHTANKTKKPKAKPKPKPKSKSKSKLNPRAASFRQGGSMTITHAPVDKKSRRKRKKRVRQACGCQATLHEVLTNCTACGNILCVLEGEGPCFFCAAFVTRAGTVASIDGAAEAQAQAQAESKSAEYLAAVAQKEKLLRFGREKVAQTTIIDDQGDFYESEANNLWLTQRERAIAAERAKHNEAKLNESRADKAVEIAINIGGDAGVAIAQLEDTRKQYVVEEIDREQQLRQRVQREQAAAAQTVQTQGTSWYHNSSLTGHASKVYASLQKMMDAEKERKQRRKKPQVDEVECKADAAANKLKSKYEDEANSGMDSGDEDKEQKEQKGDERVKTEAEEEKDEAGVAFLSRKRLSKNARKKLKKGVKFSDRSDDGVCLSMHQPWASLLVLGIKRVEGRSWRTRFRGRLWIASARREPTPFEIEEVEKQYLKVYGLQRAQVPFPSEYPTTALLGCVDMVDCLANDDYVTAFVKTGRSTEMNASNYCFICESPRRLILPGQISGEHKLWKMPKERIRPMQSGLVPVDLSWTPDVSAVNKDKVLKSDEQADLEQAIAESLAV